MINSNEQITELQAEIAELRGKLTRKGTRAGRPAICLCGHPRHAAECQEPDCGCVEYVAAKTTNAERCKRYRVKKENNGLHLVKEKG